ncbi:MAG: peptidase C39 family protein [Gammaproteobacteria bacterium]
MHDPEIKPERSEDRTDKQDVPIDRAAFARMARFGQNGMRAALLLSRVRQSARSKR